MLLRSSIMICLMLCVIHGVYSQEAGRTALFRLGADAMAGVINVVTHSSDRPVTAQADIALGSNGQE